MEADSEISFKYVLYIDQLTKSHFHSDHSFVNYFNRSADYYNRKTNGSTFSSIHSQCDTMLRSEQMPPRFEIARFRTRRDILLKQMIPFMRRL